MSNRLRRKSRPQADVELYGGPLRQKTFKGGMNLDRPASEIGNDQIAYGANVICFDHHVEARPGVVNVSDVIFTNSSGTYHNFVANPSSLEDAANAQYLMHRGSGLYFVDSPITADTEIVGAKYDGTAGASFGVNNSSTIRPFRRGALVFTDSKIAYVRTGTGGGWFQANAANPVYGLTNDTSAASTYIRRYLVTFTRIVDSTGAPTTGDRETAGNIIEHESGTNDNRSYSGGTVDRDVDYAVVYKAAAFSSSSAYTISAARLQSVLSSLGNANNNAAAEHFTHVSIYATLDLGSTGLDPENGKGNSRNNYMWVGDHPRASIVAGTGFSDNVDDDTLRRRLEAGGMYILQSRGLQPMPSGAVGEVTPAFVFSASRTTATRKTRVYYSQVDASPEHVGYYFPSQFKEFGDAVTAIRASGDILSIFGVNSTHTCTLTSWTDQSSGTTTIFLLNHWTTVDETLGVRDWGTVAQVDRTTLIAVCSDGSVRTWDSTKWGPDLAYDAVSSEIAQIVPANPADTASGSFGVFYRGAYYLWYSKDSSDTGLTNVLRYGFGGRAGNRWTFYTNWPILPYRCGATLVVDDNSRIQRLLCVSLTDSGTYVDETVYWLESFTAYTGATDGSVSLVRSDDGVTTSIRFREMTASEESEELVHRETHVYLRPLSEANGFDGNLRLGVSGYVNGATTPRETLDYVPRTGDIHFTQELSGRRIQIGLTTTTGGFRLVGIDSHCRSLDRINYATAGDNSTSESTSSNDAVLQANLATGLVSWMARRDTLRDLATGSLFAQSGTVSATAGADSGTNTANAFSSSSLSRSAPTFASGESFCVSLFVKDFVNGVDFFSLGGATPFTISYHAGTNTLAAGPHTGVRAITASNWNHIAVVRSGGLLVGYVNGLVTIAAVADAASYGGGTLTIGTPSSSVKLFDVRLYSTSPSPIALVYLYNDATQFSGARTMPMV